MTHDAYHLLEARFTRMSALEDALSLLHWDSAVMMPEGSNGARSDVLATLTALLHEQMTDPSLGDLLAKAESQSGGLTPWQLANLREMKRQYLHETAVEPRLVEEITRQSSLCEHAWRTARKENDFATFARHLKPLLALVREKAAMKGEALGLYPYDALLDSYDPGTRSAEIDRIFALLEQKLPSLLAQALAMQANRPEPLPLEGSFDTTIQKALGEQFMTLLGFDFQRGRLDVSHHPFCGGSRGDVRLTTRYRTENFTESFYGVLHETGHALYELGLPEEWRSQPVGQARGMSTHESQSLFVEMQLCLSPAFLEFAAPRLKSAFGGSGAAWEPENIYRDIARVEPGLIRVTADEVTYPLHVILRYRLERQLIDGALEVEHLPEVWREGMRSLLGIVPETDADGCMQDIHWSGGAFGYFPTYTLGAMMAAQWAQAIGQQLPQKDELIRKGEFAPIIQWLRDHIHRFGSFHSTQELLVNATGEALNPEIYLAHLARRYAA
jgi:carboxypeptidase Taq